MDLIKNTKDKICELEEQQNIIFDSLLNKLSEHILLTEKDKDFIFDYCFNGTEYLEENIEKLLESNIKLQNF